MKECKVCKGEVVPLEAKYKNVEVAPSLIAGGVVSPDKGELKTPLKYCRDCKLLYVDVE